MAPTVKNCHITQNWLVLETQALVTFSLIYFCIFLQKWRLFGNPVGNYAGVVGAGR